MRYVHCIVLVGLVSLSLFHLCHAQDEDAETFLRHVRAGHIEEVEKLLGAGIDPNVANRRGRTALMLAAEEDHEALVRLLLQHGADVDLRSPGNTSALLQARSAPVLNILLEAGADPNVFGRGRSIRGTRLTAAVIEKDEEAVRALLAAGADPNLNRPLRYAGPKTAPLLLEAGANPDARIDDWSADDQTLLMAALRSGDAEGVQLLLDAGADLTTADAEGTTVLMYALRHGNEAVVEAALDAGADLTAQTEEGVTVLFLAAGANDVELIRAALEAGADVEAGPEQRSPMGPVTFTPLMAATTMGQVEAARLLLSAGADPEGPGDAPIDPLTMAAMRGDAPIVHLLLEVGADPEATVMGIPLVDIVADPEATAPGTEVGEALGAGAFGTPEGRTLVLALLRGRGGEPGVRRAVALSEEARSIARRLKAWIRDHENDPRLQSLDPSDMNALFQMAGLSSEAGPLVGEHGTYMLAFSLFADELAVVCTNEATEFAVEAIIGGSGRRDVITLQASRSGAEAYGERVAAYAEDRREARSEGLANDARRIASEIQEWARKPKAFGGGNDGIDEMPEDDVAGVTIDALGYPADGGVYSNALGSFEIGTNSSRLACDDPPVPEGASSQTEQLTLYAYDLDDEVCVRIDLHGAEEEDIATAVTPSP